MQETRDVHVSTHKNMYESVAAAILSVSLYGIVNKLDGWSREVENGGLKQFF